MNNLKERIKNLSPDQKELLKEKFKSEGVDIKEYYDVFEESSFSKIEAVEVREYYPVSSAQKRLLLLDQIKVDNINYNMPGAIKIKGNLNKDLLLDVFKQLVNRYESLRTSFEFLEGNPVQKIHDYKELDFEVAVIKAKEGEEKEIIKGFIRPFNLNKAPLIRVGLIEKLDDEYILLLDMHHIISDGVSINILLKEITELYQRKELKELEVQYKDFAIWQNELFKSSDMDKQRKYWLDRFQDEIPVLDLPIDYPRPKVQKFEGDRIDFELSEDSIKSLKNICKETNTTLYMVLLSIYTILLSKYSGQEDIIIGSPIAGRKHIDLENIIGMFVNTLAIRNYPKGEKNFIEFLDEVRENTLNAYENQDYQFEELVDELELRRDISRNPLFDVMFTMQNMGNQKIELENLELKEYSVDFDISKFDMTLYAREEGSKIKLQLEYATKLLKRETIERFVNHFLRVVEQVSNKKNIKLSEIEIITEEEKKKMLYEFNDTEVYYPKNRTIHGLFEEQAERIPNNIAVVFGDKKLTYKELNERSNQLARVLKEKGVKEGTIVGIMVEHSLEMVIGIVAILKAGGAYLPIDITYPVNRINYMLDDSGVTIVLLTENLNYLIKHNIDSIYLDKKESYLEDCSNIANINKSSDLAYIIYTSGTTGKPKGVMIPHNNVVRLLINDKIQFDFSSKDTWTMFHSFCFDFSVWEMYGALLYGGKLVIISKDIARSPKEFLNLLKEQKVTVLNQTPSAFYNLINEELDSRDLKLRYIIFGGEALKPGKLKRWNNKYPEVKLINMYGITETTVHVTYKEITEDEINSNISNIGRPIPTLSAYVMDEYLNLLPTGVIGELYISGEGVAKGYLNKKELTDERFIDNPFGKGKMYKTGDLARWLPNGELEYMGRKDFQVEIRGHRVELGEIESKLLKHNDVKDVVLQAKEEKEGTYLIAYLVSSKEISIMDLRKYLSEFLPEYMVPAYFIFIDEIPLTKNGKVDKKALPELDGNIKTGEKYIAPRNQIEEKLLETWVEVLKVNNIGVKDNYFSLGGDSIKAIRLISNINKKLDMSLRILDLYKNPTVEDLAYYLQNNNLIDNLESVEKIVSMIKETKDEIIKEISQDEINNIEDVYPMSDIEKGMVFYSLKNGYDGTYHDQFAYNFNYTSFDNSVLSKALELMVRKHPMLRTSFYTTDGIEDVQVVYKEVDINIREENITKLNSKEQKEYISKYCEESRKIPFDVKRAPLWRMTVFILNKDYITLVWEFHHSILDGWSNASFIEELNTTYLELKKDNNYKLDRLKSNYKDFIVGQLVAKQNQKTYAYWKKELKDYKRFSFNSASVEDDVVYNHHYNFDKEYLKRLDKISNDYGTTLKSICLAAYVYTLKMFSYESDITIGVVTNNRPLSEDGDRILGCFLNTVPFRTIIEKNITWGEYIKLIDDKLLELKGYEQLSLFEIVQAIGEKPVGVNPIFDVVFNFVDFHVYKNIDINNMEIIGYEKTNTLLDFTVNHTFNSLYLNLNYSRKLVGKDDIEKLVNYFKNFIDEIINNMESKVDNYKLLLKDEIDKVLYKFNDTKTNYPGKTINELFEEQAEKTPDNVAVVFERAHLTYKELNEKTNQLARILREKGVHEGTIVGILVKRSLEMIIGIMAILKSGGTYLPVDPNYPIKRINYMLDDSGAEIILVTENLSELVKDREKLIYLDDKKLYSGDSTNLVTINKPNDLAYIIYTSGSTGKPKGTMIEHRNVIRLFKNTNYIEIKSSDGVLQLANYVFDGSIFDIFAPLLNGSKLVLIKEKDMLNMNNLGEIIKNEEVTVFFVTTALFNTIVDTNIEMLENIRKILFGGERISISHANKAVRYLGKDKIIHVYGPTENTVFTTYYYINKVFSEDSNIPIGRPLSNSTACVVDKNGNLLPAGVIGELYVGGEGIARGYLNNEKLTGDKFIKNPFGEGRLYKTGDLVKQLPDGNIEYLDRIDNQVKIRGFRIELGDIENKLLSHKDIKKAIVIAKQNKDDKYLVSYIVSDKKININEIKEYLSKDLPKFMIPSYFIQLDEFPLNQNGKINRKILPEPDIKMEKEYIEPQSEVEKRLAKLLKEVLGVKKIGINDSFFELGGHSLKATELVSKIQREFNVNLEIMKILELENIKNIAKLIEEKINSIGEIIDKIDSDELEDLLDDIENIPIE